MERILIRYVLRNKHTKQLAFKTYYIEQIEAGGIEKLFDIENYTVVSRDRFTGLTDKNGANIFEGDVLTGCGEVFWDNKISNCGCCYQIVASGFDFGDLPSNLEVTGNIHE